MIKWVDDRSDLSILFSTVPKPEERIIEPQMSQEQKDHIKKLPYINPKKLTAIIVDYMDGKMYKFVIPENFCWDGASIPKIFWRIIGAPTDNRFLVASLCHDWLCEHKYEIKYNRRLSTRIFRQLLLVGGTPLRLANRMSRWVDIYQKLLCKW